MPLRAGVAGQWPGSWTGPKNGGAQHGGLPPDGGDGDVDGRVMVVEPVPKSACEDLELLPTTHVRAHGHGQASSPSLPLSLHYHQYHHHHNIIIISPRLWTLLTNAMFVVPPSRELIQTLRRVRPAAMLVLLLLLSMVHHTFDIC